MTSKWEGGKGSRYRDVDQKKYSDNWDAIFKNKEKSKSKNDKPNVESEKNVDNEYFRTES